MEPKNTTDSKISQCSTCHRPRKFFDRDGCDMTGCPLTVEAIALALASHLIPVNGFKLSEYELLALRTAKWFDDNKMNLMHAGMGLSSDAGEALDVVKAHTIYGKEFDREHFVEELGDSLWFIVLACKAAGVSLDYVAARNIAKLRQRYPNKYSDEQAIARADKEGR